MKAEKSLVAFEAHQIRRVYDEKSETWFFSVVDIVAALTGSANPRDYWFKRIQDMGDPARSLDRAREYWKQHGRSEKWTERGDWRKLPAARFSKTETERLTLCLSA